MLMSKKLSEFKVKYIHKAMQLKKELEDKYQNRDRVEYVVDVIIHKLYTLKSHSLPDYLHTIYLACKEFSEICLILPSEEEISEILSD